MKEIAKRQNEELYLKLQFAARKLFNRAELTGYLTWFFCMVSVVVGLLCGNDSHFIFAIIIIVSEVAALFFDKYTAQTILNAADLRALFDHHVLNLPLPKTEKPKEELLEIAENLKQNHYKEYSYQISHTGKQQPPGVKDWYDTEVDVPKGSCAAYYVFKNNQWWDKKMVLFKTVISIALLIAVILVFIFIFLNLSFSDSLWFVVGSLALTVKIVERIVISTRYHDASVKIDTLLNIFDTLGKDKAIPEIQNAITARRRLPVVHINLFHNVKAFSYHLLFGKSNQKM